MILYIDSDIIYCLPQWRLPAGRQGIYIYSRSVGMADKHGSEPCARKGVGVQLSPLALIFDYDLHSIAEVYISLLLASYYHTISYEILR